MSEKAAIDTALQANKEHQHALKAYIEQLEKELQTVDEMIEEVDAEDDEDLAQYEGAVYVEGAKKPVSMVLPRMLLSDDSPFYEDAQWKKRYDEFATINQMRAREHDALREAVRSENMRMQILDAQKRNQPIDIKAFPPNHFEQNTEGIDWKRVSVKVNSMLPSGIPRAPRECKIRWLGYLHPSINNGPWSPEETERLRDILGGDDTGKYPKDWVDIARRLGTDRTPIDCMRHGMTRRIHAWTPESDQRLLEAVELYGQNNWQLVAMSVSEDATAHQCQKRYLDSLDPSIKNGPWTSEEDEQLRRAIAAFAGESALSAEANTSKKQSIPWPDIAPFVPGRTNNQCREHYLAMLKSRGRKGKKKLGRSSKGKEKALTPDGPGDEDKTDNDSDLSDHEELGTAQMDRGERTSKAKARGGARCTRKEPDKNGESGLRVAGPSSAPEPPPTPRPDSKARIPPRPRTRFRRTSFPQGTSESSPGSAPEGPQGETGLQVEAGRDGPPSDSPHDAKDGKEGTSPVANSSPQGRRRSSRSSRGKQGDARGAGDVESSREIDVAAQELASVPSEPANKRRRTIPSPRKGAGKSARSASSPGQDQTVEAAESTSGIAPVTMSAATGNKDLRRSSRLARSVK